MLDRTHAVFLLILAGMPSLMFAQQTPAEPAQTIRISGQIVDITGAVIPNSSVTLASSRDRRETKTDERGRFSFPSVPPEKFHLQSIAPDFQQTGTEVNGMPGKDIDLGDIVLQVAVLRCPEVQVTSIIEVPSKSPESASYLFISGRVAALDKMGPPIAGATVTLQRPGAAGPAATTKTAKDGVFSLPFVPTGEYELRVEQAAFRPRQIRMVGNSPQNGYVGTLYLTPTRSPRPR